MEVLRLAYDGIEVGIAVGDDRPPSLRSVEIAGIGGLFDAPGVPLVEVLTAADGHSVPLQRLSGTLVGSRLRYRSHRSVEHGWALDLVDPNGGLDVILELTSLAAATLTATTTVANRTDVRQTVTAVTSLNVPATVRIGDTSTRPATTEVYAARGEWMGENRWHHETAGDLLVDLHLSPGATRKGSHRWVSTGSWSTADALPVGLIADTELPWAMGWQIEHNGAWRSELAELHGCLQVTLSGPTDVDHGWLAALRPGDRFTSVPITLAFGTSPDAAIGALTAYRRSARRPHRDNVVPTLIYNDYMNTLMGDPSTEKLLPLIEQAADVGAEAFCIDAGWYDDSSGWWDSVGAWQPSSTRFPGGVDEVLQAIRDHGMVPGLWLEPEVVGIHSPVAASLPPEAFFQRAGVRIQEAGRHHLDLRHPAARSHLDAVVDRLVDQHAIGYFKFDYNINPGPGTDRDADSVGAGLLEHNRAHLAWIDGILDRHPDLVIENCASGAMRMDFAMMSRLQLQSTTDQEDLTAYAPISVAAPMSVLPEQAASWAYPSVEMDDEETSYVLSLGLLGRLYLSGFLDRLRPGQRAMVRDAVAAYKAHRASIPLRRPVWPTGLPGWDDSWLSLGLVGDEDTLMTVFRRGAASPEVPLHLPAFVGRELEVEPVFPHQLTTWATAWDPGSGTLWVLGTGEGLAARTLRLTPTT